MKQELQDFRSRRIESTGYEQLAARQGAHDDLPLSLCCALHWGQTMSRDLPGGAFYVRASAHA